MGAVREAAEGLIQVMDEILILVEKLNNTAKQKGLLLAEPNIDGLNEVVEQEEDLVALLRDKELERIAKVDVLSATLGVSGTNLSLKALLNLMEDSDYKVRLSVSGDRAAKAVDDLADANAKFKEHLQQQIDYTDYMLNILVSPRSRINSYDIQGNVGEENQEPSLLEYRA